MRTEESFFNKIEASLYYEPSVDGLSSSCLIKASQKNNKNELIIFLHGYGNDLFFPNRVMFRYFLQKGFDIYTFNLAGHGRWDKTFLEPATMEAVIRAHVEKALKLDYRKVHLIGYSLGAASALRYASDLPLDSLILIGMPYLLEESIQQIAEISLLWQKGFFSYLGAYGFKALLPLIRPLHTRSYPSRFNGKHKRSLFKLKDYWKKMIDDYKWKELTDKKAILIYGEYDFIAPSRESLIFNEKGIGFELKIIPGITHFGLLFSVALFEAIFS